MAKLNWRSLPVLVTVVFLILIPVVSSLPVLLLCYGVLLWQLWPLRALSQGVSELARGNFKHRLPQNGNSEIARLSQGFNQIAEKTEQMLRAKEELLLAVSHELRSPLTSLRLSVELLEDEKRRAQLKKYLLQMEAMVTELLESYRIASEHSSLHREPLPVTQLFAELEKHYERSRTPVVFTGPPSSASVTADHRLLERLLSNLIDNALKFSAQGGASVLVSYHATRTEDRFEIVDSGPGIPENELPRIFEPFYRADKSRSKESGGYGLGLYLCKKIVEAHQGNILVSNRPSGGCSFVVVLPKARL